MSKIPFKFYPPKQQSDIFLAPSSDIIGQCALLPKNKAVKNKVKMGINVKNFTPSPFGPVQSFSMSSDIQDTGAIIGGYGNSAYGESVNKIKKYTSYDKIKDIYNQIEYYID
jgi:hypothetical protein